MVPCSRVDLAIVDAPRGEKRGGAPLGPIHLGRSGQSAPTGRAWQLSHDVIAGPRAWSPAGRWLTFGLANEPADGSAESVAVPHEPDGSILRSISLDLTVVASPGRASTPGAPSGGPSIG
jgi:hypothetical protein